MRIDVLTLFPDVLRAFAGHSIVGRAVESGRVTIAYTNFRDFADDPHRSVDDRPFGGGPGMVLKCEPIFRAVEHVIAEGQAGLNRAPTRLLMCPSGERLTQKLVEELSRETWLLLLCGHYEGFDERIPAGLGFREISIGDYVLSGGEAAAIVLIDAVVRLLPGAVGDGESVIRESFTTGLLDYPQYTRPRSFRGLEVPEILLSGHHAQIEAWRREQALVRTRQRRPDLLEPVREKGRRENDGI
ncbi:MAG: tRNA (guanosine(37)-N1)-methyltransferase TrmD [Phycisphaerae bacterium]|nr:MAG: tRNA (guanosine(37)-N1)-methyltransferase TrmD [Planctomycetota bacterium]KAB2948227.1 MAG: tRNA (guanosine(37)-N1)-methyltransferase TrmD [Phycisphaerae bacterium]MBE7457866.1 tRNA (guanosine(37)-N1)-methyltransferase TrmD [Planctomycetia bacterium]MCK6465737.1 tRNA (guanosine(37)-N1)-methyltransferase TrmD [Phycisphaerae bacterium]MCL4719071.1 tRNA (guanosine(37)-N1)-methyltransferase TrmD [Phycisphaerae bacterium]